MRSIDRFILHVVHNWKNELNEAYSEKAIQGFINKFKEEADDLNISITDDQLRAYIKRFDSIKEKLASDQRDLTKWSLSKFIKLVTATKGAEGAEEIDITPDVVYNNDNNTIVIYNGSKQDNCVRYGNGERWCITKTSFPSYRYDKSKSYPTFYLAKNNNLSDSDKLSFVAIQVRDPNTTSSSNRYVYTTRDNSPYESNPMSFRELVNNVPWLRDVPNLESILKYIPLSTGEKVTQQYKNNSISYREWTKLPYSVKEQYLVIKKRDKLFSDITNEEFVEKYLLKYPELAKFIAETPGIIDTTLLLKNLDKFPNQIRRSITANVQDKIDTKNLPSEQFPFDVKKLLVQLNKWRLNPDERLYVTKDGNTIVKLTLGDDINVSLYQAEDDFPNIKLNKRTSKYLLDYPELDKIPLRNLLKLSEDGVIDKDILTKVLDDAKKDPNSAVIVKPVEDGEIVLDSNSFSSYKIDNNGKISSIPFDNEEVQTIFNDQKDNESFQQNALNLFKSREDIPSTIDKKALLSVINSIPYNQRIFQDPNTLESTILLTSPNENTPFFTIRTEPTRASGYLDPTSIYGGNGRISRYGVLDNENMASYFNYLRQTNKSFNDNELLDILKSSGINISTKKAFIRNNPPVNTNNRYKPAMDGEDALLINTQSPRDSFMLSTSRNNLKRANVSPLTARRLLGQPQQAQGQAAAQANAAVRAGRGRPAGVPNAPRPAAPAAAGDVNVGERMQAAGITNGFLDLPRSVRNRINVNNASAATVGGNRGASRRQNILGGNGQVRSVIEIGPSTVYFIRLNNGLTVASVVSQPGNEHFLITPQFAYRLGSPSDLLQVLQQRNLAEIHQYLVREYFGRNPQHLNEFKQLFNKHITEKRIK
jgi:hypothetical protein